MHTLHSSRAYKTRVFWQLLLTLSFFLPSLLRPDYAFSVAPHSNLVVDPLPRQMTVEQGEIVSAEYIPPKPVQAITEPPTYTGSHEDWMRQAGISPSDFTYVDFIISMESGWDPTNWYGKRQGMAYNPSSSAAGLPQALPYSKTGCAWGDPICQLRWADGYAKSRYNGWYQAYQYWQSHRNW